MFLQFRGLRNFVGLLVILVWNTGGTSYAFDSVLDTARQSSRWKFEGPYIYANTLQDIQELTPLLQAGSPGSGQARETEVREGIWFTKYNLNGKNEWSMSNSLTHLLFVQAWVTYLAHPSVPLVIKTRDKEMGRFWSDGKVWCDAVVNMNYNSYFRAELNISKTGEFGMVDKIVLGIMGNVTALKKRNLNPCLNVQLLEAPEMEVAKEFTNEIRRPSEPEPLVVEDKTEVTTSSAVPTQRPDTSSTATTETSMRTYQTVAGGAKCNCICSCAKPVNNATIPTTTVPPI